MTLSAAFTVNGVANPATHIVTVSSTVNLALTSTSGVSLIEWSIVEAWQEGQTLPTITPSGVPSGATASFPFDVSPAATGFDGYAYLVKCRVSNTNNESAEQYAIVGIAGYCGWVPFVPGEELARSLTHGWGQALNRALPRGEPTVSVYVKYTAGTPAANKFITRSNTLVIGDITVTDTAAGIATVTFPANTLTDNMPPRAVPVGTGAGLFHAIARPTANGAIVELYDSAGAPSDSVDFILDIW